MAIHVYIFCSTLHFKFTFLCAETIETTITDILVAVKL